MIERIYDLFHIRKNFEGKEENGFRLGFIFLRKTTIFIRTKKCKKNYRQWQTKQNLLKN